MIVKEIVFEQTAEKRREAIGKNLGCQVLLKDEHENWCHGFLSEEKTTYYNETYMIQTSDARGRLRLHYHDLQQLLILGNR